MHSDGKGTKSTPDKIFLTRDPSDTTPDKNTREQLRENLCKGLFSWFFVLGILKMDGGPRCVTYFRGVPGCVTKCDRGRGGVKLEKNSGQTFFSKFPKNFVLSSKFSDDLLF